MRLTAALLMIGTIAPVWADAPGDLPAPKANPVPSAQMRTAPAIAAGSVAMNSPRGTAYAGPSVVDQRDAAYQVAMEHAANAQRALEKAIDELALSRTSFAFPGYEYPAITRDLELARDSLTAMLLPEQRRLRYQTLIPDGMYMRVPASQSSPQQ